jgi:hypothetical protein
MSAFCLSFHAGYRCRHSGACCTAGWPIVLEPERAAALRFLRGSPPIMGRDDAPLRTGSERIRALDPVLNRNHTRGASIPLPTTSEGACVLFDADNGRLCALHRDAGPELMPSACRNFPRVALRDARGLFITLSHYCPTAARSLLDAREIAIVDAPASLSLAGEVEGLDATGVLPPLLRPGMLMDLEGYDAWEREGIGVLKDPDFSAQEAVSAIAAATTATSAWRPGAETLSTVVTRAFDRVRSGRRSGDAAHSPLEHAIKAFLAAHLFANWSAYQNGGVGAVVHSLKVALRLLKADLATRSQGAPFPGPDSFIAAVRAVDLLLRHQDGDGRDASVDLLTATA